MAADEQDPLFGQTVTGPDGVERDFKLLSQTHAELISGVSPINALEQQWDHSKPIIGLYFTSRPEKKEEHRPSECGWICDGCPHKAASVCRLCKIRVRAAKHAPERRIDVPAARCHLGSCRILSKPQRFMLRHAFSRVDTDFFAEDDNRAAADMIAKLSSSAVAASTHVPDAPTSKKRPRSIETDADMDQACDEIGRGERRRLTASIDVEDELCERVVLQASLVSHDRQGEQSGGAQQIESSRSRSRQLVLRSGRVLQAVPTEMISAPAGNSQQHVRKKQKTAHNAAQASGVSWEALAIKKQATRTLSKNASKKAKKQQQTSKALSKASKHISNAKSPATKAAMPQSKKAKAIAAEADKFATEAAFAEFGNLLKAANIENLDQLKAKLDRKRVPKFVGYLADTFPQHIDSHLTRFNLIEAFEGLLGA